MSTVVRALVRIGELEHAEDIAVLVTEGHSRAWALGVMAAAAADDDPGKGARLCDLAVTSARTVQDPVRRAAALTAVVRSTKSFLAPGGDALIVEALSAAQALHDRDQREHALAEPARVVYAPERASSPAWSCRRNLMKR